VCDPKNEWIYVSYSYPAELDLSLAVGDGGKS
jgi:hypothetical protein